MRLSPRLAPVVIVALIAAGCAGDDADSRVDGVAVDSTAPVDGGEPDPTRPDDRDDDRDDGAPTSADRSPFAGLPHDSTDPVVEFCAALATRNSDTFVGLIADDAIATDHATGVVHRGRDEIRAWLDDDPGFTLFERTECAPATRAIATHFWSATTYRLYSDTQPGGRAGVVVVGVLAGAIDRLELLYQPVAEPEVAETVSEADGAVLGAWCEAWGAFDIDRVLELATDDVRFTPNAMAGDSSFRPPPGADAIRTAMLVVSGGPVDRVDCTGGDLVANSGWVASLNRFDDESSDTSFGGVAAMQLRDGKVSTVAPFMDTMVGGTLVFESTRPGPPPDSAPAFPVADALAGLEVSGWWDYASGVLGADLRSPAVREDVAADVADVCAFLATGPRDFDEVLEGLDRVAAGRAPTLQSSDRSAYALVLETAIFSACPVDAALVDALRPPESPSSETPGTAARLVPDPRLGDVRTDLNADVLPADYVASPPFWTMPLAYGDDPAQHLDLHLPAPGGPVAGRDALPAVVFVHAGGWYDGDQDDVPPFVQRFVELGYAVASIDYRLAPEHPFPAQINDVKRAIRWLKAYLGQIVDADRIVLVGSSAGGHLATLAAATPGRFEPVDLTAEQAAVDSSVAGVVSVVGPTDLVTFYRQGAMAEQLTSWFLDCDPCSDERLAEASPLTYLSAELPPAHWIYGSDDVTLVEPNSQGAAIASAWAEHAGPASSSFDLVEGKAHNIPHYSINQRALEEFVERAIA